MGIISYAQNFEDVMLWRALGDIEHGFYVDIGSQHPTTDSVNKAFYERGWKGVHVEPTMYYANLLRADRPDELVIQAAVAETAGLLKFYEIPDTGLSTAAPEVAEEHRTKGFKVVETVVNAVTLDDVFEALEVDDVHWLKIDVEGFEREIFLGWKKSVVRPWVVVVESTFPNSQLETHEAWETLLLEKGYSLAYVDGLNRFYVFFACDKIKESFRFGPNVFDGYQLASCLWSVGNLKYQYLTQIGELDRSKAQLETNVSQLLEEKKVAEVGAAARENRLSQEAALSLATYQEEFQIRLQAAAEQIQTLKTKAEQLGADLRVERDRRTEVEVEREVALREQGNVLRDQCAERERYLHRLLQEAKKGAESERVAQAEAHLKKEQQLLEAIADLQREASRLDEAKAAQRIELELQTKREIEALQVRIEWERAAALKSEHEIRAESASALELAKEREQAAVQQLLAREVNFSEQISELYEAGARTAEIQAQQHNERERLLTNKLSSINDALAAAERRAVIREEVAKRDAEEVAKHLKAEVRELKQRIQDQTHTHGQELLRLEAASKERHRIQADEFRKREEGLLSQLEASKESVLELENKVVAGEASLRKLVWQYEQAYSASTTLHAEAQAKLMTAIRAEQDSRNARQVQDRILRRLRRQVEFYRMPLWRRAIEGRQASAHVLSEELMWENDLPMANSDLQENCGTSEQMRLKATANMETGTDGKRIGQMQDVYELLGLNCSLLVPCTYQLLLGRAPDSVGERYYRSRLAAGHSKESVVAQIAMSAEARQANKHLDGLKEFLTEYLKGKHWLFQHFNRKELLERQLRKVQYSVELVSQRCMDLEYKLHRRVAIGQDAITHTMEGVGENIAQVLQTLDEMKDAYSADRQFEIKNNQHRLPRGAKAQDYDETLQTPFDGIKQRAQYNRINRANERRTPLEIRSRTKVDQDR